LGDKFAGAVTDLQQAIQKSVSEAIERVSLEAQVEGLVAQKEALIKQLTTLEEQLQGKSAEVGAGAESSGTKFTARVTPKGKDDGKDFEIVTTKKSAPKVKFHNGPDIVLLNTSEEPISFTFSVDQSWLKAPSAIAIQTGETKTVALRTTNKAKDLRPHGWGGAKDYNGTITITGGGEPITLEVHLRKNKKGTV